MPTMNVDLLSLDGYEFLTCDDNSAVVDYDFETEALPGPINPDSMELGRDQVTGLILNTVTFRGEDVLPRLDEWNKDHILESIEEHHAKEEWHGTSS